MTIQERAEDDALRLVPDGDRWRVPIVGAVDQVAIDFSVQLSGSGSRADPLGDWSADFTWHVRIEAPFRLTRRDRSVQALVPGCDFEALAPALVVTHQTMISMHIWRDGRLRMAFDGGEVVDVEAVEFSEAWEVHVGRGWLVAPIAPGTFREDRMEPPVP